MPRSRYPWELVGILVITLLFFLSSCAETPEVEIPITRQPPPTVTPTAFVPTEIPPPPKTLIVCLAQEPDSLFLYADTQPEKDTILQAIYDGPVDVRTYAFAPVILTKLPSFEDGDATREIVTVTEGDFYQNPLSDIPEQLEPGKPYLPPGCNNLNCVADYSGGDVEMDRLVVDYELLPGLTWSDGEPLKASDSVYSYNVDSEEMIPTTKYLVMRTTSYTALDEQRTRWVGIPGFLDAEFEGNFWTPLPEHILGVYSPMELLDSEEANRTPLGWGPYSIESWEPGSQITMRRSEGYFRAAEGLPHFDLLRFRFLGTDYVSAIQQVLTGECDILDESLLPSSQWKTGLGLEAEGRLIMPSIPGAVMERLDFNLAPSGSGGTQPYFTDLRTREAIAACIDRENLVEEILLGLSVVPETYLPQAHPFHTSQEEPGSLTLDQASQLLEAVGWRDEDGDSNTPRLAEGVFGIPDGTPLEFRYLTIEWGLSEQVAEQLSEDLSRCGISLVVDYEPADEIFAPWPDGPVFGGHFDTVGWAWPTYISPACEMFAGFEVPSIEHVYGINASGFISAEYDQACRRVLLGPADTEDFLEAVWQTEEVYRNEIPSIPLLMWPRATIHGTEICGLELDPTAGVLWNLEEIAQGDVCGS
ncbi:MAG: hypothetical protein GTO18_03995 [Anaerolineales bacterium]|nr:hypothetical protein [Anaerolineales bacterium]